MNGLSVIIPNWNGAEDLFRTLPKNYIKLLKLNIKFEIIVVDDASTDESVELLDSFPYVKVIKNDQNEGFSRTANKGVLNAVYDKALILSNDIIIGQGLKFCFEHFAGKNVFAVSPQVRWINDGSFAYGRRKVVWENGYFKVKESGFTSDPCYSLFACGGSAVFDRDKFLSLGGFDSLYHPFYWEEVDLSYRAWKQGFSVIHEPRAIVYNKKSGVIKSSFSNKRIKLVSGRNSYFFLWKNIHSRKLIRNHLSNLFPSLVKDILSLKFRFPICFLMAFFSIAKVLKTRFIEKDVSVITDMSAINIINGDNYLPPETSDGLNNNERLNKVLDGVLS